LWPRCHRVARQVVAALAALGVPCVTNGNVRCAADVQANLAQTGAAGIMVAEHLLKDPALFARARAIPPTAAAPTGKQGEGGTTAVAAESPLPPPDSPLSPASPPKPPPPPLRGVGVVEAYLAAVASSAALGLALEDGSTPAKNGAMARGVGGFERLSLWWTNAEVVKAHVRGMLDDELCSRATFTKATTVAAVVACFRRRVAALEPGLATF
jgi:tRNA-dihydrouridine synthase